MNEPAPTRQMLEPPAPAPLEVGASLPGGWTVKELAPRLVFEQRWTDSLFRRAMIPLGPALIASFLFSVTRDASFWAQVLAWSLAVAMFLIALLGVLNLLRSWRRLREGVRLVIEPDLVTGYPEARTALGDYFVGLEEHPRARVKGAALTVYRDPKRRIARARIHLELEGGQALVGPEASGEDVEWVQIRDALLPAAAAVARALDVKLHLHYPWCGQRVDASW